MSYRIDTYPVKYDTFQTSVITKQTMNNFKIDFYISLLCLSSSILSYLLVPGRQSTLTSLNDVVPV